MKQLANAYLAGAIYVATFAHEGHTHTLVRTTTDLTTLQPDDIGACLITGDSIREIKVSEMQSPFCRQEGMPSDELVSRVEKADAAAKVATTSGRTKGC